MKRYKGRPHREEALPRKTTSRTDTHTGSFIEAGMRVPFHRRARPAQCGAAKGLPRPTVGSCQVLHRSAGLAPFMGVRGHRRVIEYHKILLSAARDDAFRAGQDQGYRQGYGVGWADAARQQAPQRLVVARRRSLMGWVRLLILFMVLAACSRSPSARSSSISSLADLSLR
jgi:hypothetical protein